jgi:hypothetical protein
VNLIRGALLAGGFRTHHQLIAMSANDQRNTLIVEMANHSNQTNYQSFSDVDLAGAGLLMVFLLQAGIRTAAQLKTISADDQRNIMIVEIDGSTHLGGTLKGFSNIDLVLLGLGRNAAGSTVPSSFIRGILLAGGIRTHHQLIAMTASDQRNTLIVEMAGHTNQPVAHFKSLSDLDLAGAGAAMVFLLKGGIRDAAQLKTISDNDQRNIAIVEVGGQTHLGARLQGLRTIDVVATALGVDPVFPPSRFCNFMDPPGSPAIGIRAYGLKDGHGRGSPLTYSSSGSIPGCDLATTVKTAFNLWAAATIPSPGRSPSLQVSPAVSGSADVAVGVGLLSAPAAGSTTGDGKSITISSTASFSPSNPVAAGTCSLLAVVTHEVGHALGLLHSTNPASVMNPSNCTLETLSPEDIAAVRVLYAWQGQTAIANVGTDQSPALCACGNSLVMAWRGINETNLWVSRSDDGVKWTPQARVLGAASTDGPALAWDGSTLWMVFRGISDDDGLYWATCTDTSANFAQGFSPVQRIPNTGSRNGPSVTIFNGEPLLVWRGAEDDDTLYYATHKGVWSGQQSIGGVGSDDRPGVCIDFNGQPRMVWRGIKSDDSLYTSALVGSFWQPQDAVRWIIAENTGPTQTVGIGFPGSDLGPSAATSDAGQLSFTGGAAVAKNVFLVWRGIHNDSGIYFTQGVPGGPGQPPIEWSTQAVIGGVSTSHRPGIALLAGRIHIVWKGSGNDTTIWTTSL